MLDYNKLLQNTTNDNNKNNYHKIIIVWIKNILMRIRKRGTCVQKVCVSAGNNEQGTYSVEHAETWVIIKINIA